MIITTKLLYILLLSKHSVSYKAEKNQIKVYKQLTVDLIVINIELKKYLLFHQIAVFSL